MRRVLGAAIIVIGLGGAHAARWFTEPPEPGAHVARVSPGSAARPAAAPARPAAPDHSAPFPARYHDDPLRFLSTAPADSLDLLPGIGPVLAARIVADRAARGPYTTWTELDRVRGVGPATIRRLEGAARRR
jgi:competence protein ComEA